MAKWFRREYKTTARRPIKIENLPAEIYWIADPGHLDPRMREAAGAVDVSPGDIERIRGGRDRSGAMSGAGIPSSEMDYHKTPRQFLTRNARLFWAGLGNKAGGSKTIPHCFRCDQPVEVSQAELVENESSPTGWDYQHKSFAYGGCNETQSRTEFGPKGRGR
jgi:hypothetical protein